MASSSRGSEDIEEVANEIPEDLLLSWTRDATMNTFVESDRQLLKELIQCVHKGKDASATEQKLSVLLGTGGARKSVVIRARVLAKLIAIALGLHPDDITIDSETGKESLRPSVDFQTALNPKLAEALQLDNSVLSYLFKDALEADDEVMSVIFCDPRYFEMYQVPYFNGCNLAVVREISNLWLAQEFRRGFYYYTVLAPLSNHVKAEQLQGEDTPVKAEQLQGEDTPVKAEQLKEEDTPMKAEQLKGEDTPVKAEQVKERGTPLQILEDNLPKAMPKTLDEITPADYHCHCHCHHPSGSFATGEFPPTPSARSSTTSDDQSQIERRARTELRHQVEALMMLCELLQRRTAKAGARLLEVMLSFRNDKAYRFLEVVKGLVIPLLGFKNGTGSGKFRKCFLGDFQKLSLEERWYSQGSDQVRRRHGQSITIGPSSAQTDSNLLCWAARRGYFNLIWCISLGYTKARPKSPSENLLEDATEALAVSLLWKVALWCATRHGQDSVVMELTRPSWVKHIDFNNYAGIQRCLPPLHLVSLLGDRSLLHVLNMGGVGIVLGAHKTDYLGKTPLDYAMQFQRSTRNSKEGMQFQVITKDIKDRVQFQVPNTNFKEWSQLRPVARYSTTMPQPNYWYGEETQHSLSYSGVMSLPAPGHESCIQELLQMPGVENRLKELNDMYTTQANFVLVGAALIASVTFGGWLQPPLGYTDYFQFTQQYVAVEGHLSVRMFVAFNALSFFWGIGTMLIGAVATLFIHDNDERTLALMKVRKSIKWMLGFFIASMVCIMAAFICAGLAILPPIRRLEWSMIVSLCLGACICLIPLTWILFSLARDQVVKLKDQMVKLIEPFAPEKKLDDSLIKSLDDSLKDLGGSLLNEEDMKTLHNEIRKKSSGKVNPGYDEFLYTAKPHVPWWNNPDGSLEGGPLKYGRPLFPMYEGHP